VWTGSEPEELHIQHVGEPGKREPVREFGTRESPPETSGGEPSFYLRVLVNVDVVIEVKKLKACNR
jgi:hypothetical protein